ncbi:MAG: hypothetical protein ACM3JD_13160 [Rudaea sp.]
MFASIVTGQGSNPETGEQAINYWKGLPPEKGYLRGYMLIDRKTGSWVTFNLWETEADARAYGAGGEFQRDLQEAQKLGSTGVTREVLEVVAEK